MNKQFWTAKTLDLPRWVWASMLAGGLLLGLYIRHNDKGPQTEGEGVEEGYENSGNLMPPAAPISGGGGGGGLYSISPEKSAPPPPESEKLPEEEAPEHEIPELPESAPPPETIVPQPHKPPPTENKPIHAPIGGPVKLPEQIGVGPGHPAPGGPGVGPGHPAPPVSPEHDKAMNEINRLQAEINALQETINTLTNWIQAHPKAKDRGSWEQSRNECRSNIDNKRQQVEIWRSRL